MECPRSRRTPHKGKSVTGKCGNDVVEDPAAEAPVLARGLRRQSKEPSKLRDLSTFILDHIDAPLPVERIAARVGMSPRTLTRWCQEHLQESPAQLVRKLRVEEAKRLLEETSLSVKDICARTGLTDASTMWRAFMDQLGVTPMEYRQRFAAGAALGA